MLSGVVRAVAMCRKILRESDVAPQRYGSDHAGIIGLVANPVASAPRDAQRQKRN